MNFSEKVYQLCEKIPKGKLSTYGEIAKILNTKAYQAVGQALKRNPNPDKVPCFKIVKSNGKIGGFAGKTSGKKIKEKIKLLEKEGIKIRNNKVVNFKKLLYKFVNIKH